MNIIEMIANETMLPSSTVMAFIHTAPYRYRKYPLPKKSGGVREIAQPSRDLKVMQRLVLDKISQFLPIHENAFAYIEGKSIKSNADKHKKNKYLLKMDFEDFFNSIKTHDLISVLISNGFESDTTNFSYIEKVFFYKKTKKSGLSLSIGAPSSPWISNAVMFEFDVKVTKLCDENNITYTRYADDLTFSCKEKGKLLGFSKEITKITLGMKSPEIKLNLKKTVLASKGVNRHVTGIVINNDGQLSIGRAKKRFISSLIHQFTLNKLDKEAVEKLKGYIAYVNYIESGFIESMKKKYGADIINSIRKHD